MWSFLGKILCAREKNVYSAVLDGMFYRYLSNSVGLLCHISIIPLLIFCLEWSICWISGVQKSPTVIVLISIFPFYICGYLLYICRCSWIECTYFNKYNILILYQSLYHNIVPFFVFFIAFVFGSILSHVSIFTSIFLSFLFAWNVFFSVSHFQSVYL